MTITWAKDKWFGADKVDHGTYCFAGWVFFSSLWPWWLAAITMVAAAVGVEKIQQMRKAAGKTTFADDPSYRDLVWDALGILAAVWVLSWRLQ